LFIHKHICISIVVFELRTVHDRLLSVSLNVQISSKVLSLWRRNKFIAAKNNKHIGFPYRRAEIYAGRVAYCSLVNCGELSDGTDRQTDRGTDASPLHYSSVII